MNEILLALALKGSFELDRERYLVGEPIGVTLRIENCSERPAFLLVPRGRANGIEIKVVQGNKFELRDLLQEPEPGLLAETKISGGETFRQKYPLSEWLLLKEPGDYSIECTVTIEVSDKSMRNDSGGVVRIVETFTVSTQIPLTIFDEK
jgi:hypothetical protein